MNERLRNWLALAVFLVALLASGLAFGQDPDPCHVAYLQSGLTQQQMTFDDFRHSYADSLCAADDLASAHGGRVLGETR
jgi:hypothetical protein